MGSGFSKMPVGTQLTMGALAVGVLAFMFKTGFFVFIFSGLVFNAALLYTGYNIIYYSFTSPVGDDDPHKKLKSALENEMQLREQNEKLRDAAPAKDEIAGWFTMRTSFEETKEGDNLFETKREGDSGAGDNGASSDKKDVKKHHHGGKQTLAGRALDTYRSLSKTASTSAGPRNYFLVRLKGTVLFVYRPPEGFKPGTVITVPDKDDPTFECLGAVSVDHHTVTIEDSKGPYTGIEGRFFNKRNAIVLRPAKPKNGNRKGMAIVSKDMTDMSPEETLEHEQKTIFMFSKNNSLTEDMFFALLRVSAKPPKFDHVFSRPHLKWLIDEVSVMTDPSGLGWFNAFVGRIFLGINQTATVEHFIIAKINKKLALAKHPMITSLKATKADVGHIPPLFRNAMLKRTELYGDIAFQAHMNYRGAPDLPHSGIRITIEADVGIKILLSLRIKSLSGDVEVRIKQAPTDRFWWAFVEPPKMDMEIVPVVGSRTINLSMVTSFIDKKLREGMAESIVLPNLDDIPFFSTEGMTARGGIFDEAAVFAPKSAAQMYRDRIQAGEDDDSATSEEGQDVPSRPTSVRPDSIAEEKDVLETHQVLRTETTPALGGKQRKVPTKHATMGPAAIATDTKPTTSTSTKPTTATSMKPTTSDSGSPQDDKRPSRDLATTSAASVTSNGTGSTSTTELPRGASPSSDTITTGDDGTVSSNTTSTASILEAVRLRDKAALKSQANVAKDSLKKWGVSFVNKRRQPTKRESDDEGDLSVSTTPPPAPSAYYVPSPDAAHPPGPRIHSGMTLQERLNAAAQSAKPVAHARVASNASGHHPTMDMSSSPPAPSIQPRKVARPVSEDMAPMVMQPAARQMIVPHVPKRPGVPTSISSDPPAPAPAPPAPGPTNGSASSLPLVSNLNSSSPVPRASPAPPKVSRGDSDPLPEPAVDIAEDDSTEKIRPVTNKASSISSPLVDI